MNYEIIIDVKASAVVNGNATIQKELLKAVNVLKKTAEVSKVKVDGVWVYRVAVDGSLSRKMETAMDMIRIAIAPNNSWTKEV